MLTFFVLFFRKLTSAFLCENLVSSKQKYIANLSAIKSFVNVAVFILLTVFFIKLRSVFPLWIFVK